METAMEKKVLEISGIPITYLDSGGDGTPVLFIHGNSTSAETFRPQLESELAASFRMIALDLPGHGDSGRLPVTEYGVPLYARRVAALATSLGIDDAVVVGWSLGGHIALEAATLLRAARGFVIYGTPPLHQPPNVEAAFLPEPAFAAGMTGALTDEMAAAYARSFLGDAGDASLEAEFKRQILATDPNARTGLAMNAGTPYQDQVEIVRHMERPLAILHGAEERLVGLDYLRRLEAPTLWRGEVQVIQHAGHAPHVEQPAAFNGLLAAFVEEVA